MKKIYEALYKVLNGIPQRVRILGFFRNIPILHDPKYPTPDGVMYFMNHNIFKTKNKTIR